MADTEIGDVLRFGQYLSAHAYSVHTVRNYCSDIEVFIRYLIGNGTVHLCKVDPGESQLELDASELSRLSPATIGAYVSYLFLEGNSKASIKRRLASVKAFFRFKCRQEDFPDNPALLVSAPKSTSKPPVFLSVNEAFALVESAGTKQTFFSIRDRAILEILYSTGIRVAELCALSLFDLDPGAGQIRVFGKGGKERLVPMGNAASKSLKSYLSLRSRPSVRYKGPKDPREKAVFLNRAGTRLSDRSVNKIVHRYTAISGMVKEIGPHKLRHTCATHLYDSGMGIRDLQELLGHESISTTSIYTHAGIERLKKVYKKAHPRA